MCFMPELRSSFNSQMTKKKLSSYLNFLTKRNEALCCSNIKKKVKGKSSWSTSHRNPLKSMKTSRSRTLYRFYKTIICLPFSLDKKYRITSTIIPLAKLTLSAHSRINTSNKKFKKGRLLRVRSVKTGSINPNLLPLGLALIRATPYSTSLWNI